jgi:exosortase E/protease (VPEID-CTERM system)
MKGTSGPQTSSLLLESEPAPSDLKALLRFGLPQRLAIFVLIFAAEWISVVHWVHKGRWVALLFRLALVIGSLFLALGYVKAKSSFQRISRQLETTPILWGFFAAHLGLFLCFFGLAVSQVGADYSSPWGYALAATRFAVGVAAIALAGFALIPPSFAFALVASAGRVWAYSTILGVIVWQVVNVFPTWNASFWKPVADLTFTLVRTFLSLFVSDVVADRTTMMIGSRDFSVTIAPACSGFEGTALMLVFGAIWLWFIRAELRFPQALLLLPAALGTIWLSNAIRITLLILIGIAGAPTIATGGFHSQAGWIAFNAVALGFCAAAGRWSWIRARRSAPADHETRAANPVAPYLVPFLMVLTAAMISRAATGGVEWLYPLRFFAAAAALWFFRRKYSELDWNFGWPAPVIGAVVFCIWIAADRLSGAHPDNNAMAAVLASWPAAARIAWLALRTAAAVITVPIAEELAFRGFALRRLISPEFESVSFRRFSLFAFLISSVAFGMLHGDRWLAGSIAGMLYAAVTLRSGRIGDAVVAHATTNALLAAWVIISGSWDLWS